VTHRARKYALDTQLFINALRDPVANEALQRLHRAFSPFEHLSVIVAQELRAGVKRPSVGRRWKGMSAKQEGLEIARVSKAFANDILLALSCRESGCVLVTENVRDFSRIRQFVSFEFMKPQSVS
jgi:predicted nucleic acid-binding protein